MYNIICKFRGVAMRLDISRVLTHDNYTLAGWFAGELTAAQRKQATDSVAYTHLAGQRYPQLSDGLHGP